MTENRKKGEKEEPFELDFGFGKLNFGGLLKGFGKFVDLAEKLEEAGGEIQKQGEFKVRGAKDLKGVFGFSVRTGIGKDGREMPVVRPFGNIKKTHGGAVVEDRREPLIDLFEEADSIQVVAEMPGVAEEEIEYELQGDVLILRTLGERKYSKEILLPCMADPGQVEKKYRNGVLELRLKKSARQPGGTAAGGKL